MNVPVHRLLRRAKLSACSALLTRFPSFICALVITLVCALSLSTASGQAVVAATGSKTATSGSSSSNNPSVNKPDNLAVGNLMIMSVCIEGGSDNNVTTASGSGWTKIIQQNNSSNVGVAVFWKIANSTDVAAPTFSASLSQSKINSIGILRITGHNASAPIAAFGGANSSTASAITTTAANQRVLTFHGVKKSSTFTASGRTEIYDVAANTASHAVYHYNQVAQGSTGTKATTLSQSAETVSIQVAIATAPAATPTITASGTVTARSTTYGTASSAASFTVSGSALTGNLTVTPPAGFQTSLAEGSGYGSSTSITASGTLASTTVFVRLAAATAPGSYSGNISIAGGGATSQSIAIPSSTVAQKTLTVTGLTGTNKVYNRSTEASASGTAALSGVVGSDVVSLSGSPAFAFASANVGTGVVITTTGYTLSGTNQGNYTVTQPSLSANITAKELTISGMSVSDRAYSGTTTVAVTGGSLVGVVSPDDVSLGGSPTGTVTTATVGDGKAVTVTGYSISGAQAVNYSLTQPTGLTVNITKATPTIVTAPTASAITYGQTLADSTLTGGNASTAGSFAFTTPATAPNAGTASQGVTFTPADAVNYNTAAGTVNVTVTPRNLTITGLAGTNKVYDRSTTASASGTAALDGVLGADIVSLSGTPAFSFVSPNVGTGIVIATTGYTVSGTNAANYTLTQPSLSANITAKSLTVTGLTGNDKAADGTTNATASGTAALQGVEAGDSVSLAGTPIFTFATAGVGTDITITTTGYTLAGDNAGNYTLTQPLLSANILDVPVLVTGTAGSITRTTAQISGNEITSDGGSAITERGVVFSTNTQPTVSDTKVAVAGELGAFAASLSGLTGGTTYYVRAYATNALTTVYGSAISFTANAKPVFSGMALTVTKGGSLQIIESKLRPRITDPESNTVTITGAAATSQHGGTVTRSNRVITYTPSASFSGNDTFAVTVDDGFGASNITLTVAVTEDPLFTSAANAPRITTLDGGVVRVTFNGIPGRTYGIQRSTTMAGGTWTQISAVTAGSNSVVTFDDLNPPTTSAFYRIAFPAQ